MVHGIFSAFFCCCDNCKFIKSKSKFGKKTETNIGTLDSLNQKNQNYGIIDLTDNYNCSNRPHRRRMSSYLKYLKVLNDENETSQNNFLKNNKKRRVSLNSVSSTKALVEPTFLKSRYELVNSSLNTLTDDVLDYLEKQNWYHGNITREVAQDILETSGLSDGEFLIRKSQSESNLLILTVYFNRIFYNIFITIILKDQKCFYGIEHEKYFESISDLIDYYQRQKSSLPSRLSSYISKQILCE